MAIILSYVPLLRGFGTNYLGKAEVESFAQDIDMVMEDLPDGQAEACVWGQEDQLPIALLAMERAKEIVEHLREWSEGRPESWFHLLLRWRDDRYGMSLVPNLRKSSERWKIAFQLQHGYPPAPDSEIFRWKPLCVRTMSMSNLTVIRANCNMSRVKVGLVDTAVVRREPLSVGDGDAHWIGTFETGPVKGMYGSLFSQMMDEYLDGLSEPEQGRRS